MEDIYENIHTPAQQATNTLAQSPPTSSENLYHYMVGAQAAIKQLKEGVVVTVYSLKRKPERLHLMALPDLCLLQCVRALGARPEITGKMERKMEKGDLGRRKTLCVYIYISLCVVAEYLTHPHSNLISMLSNFGEASLFIFLCD